MFRALVWKEVRGCWPFALAALLAQLALCVNRLGAARFEPVKIFEEAEFVLVLQFITILFPVFLGFWQTLTESASGTAAFAFQTARNRKAILASKVAAGLALYGLAVVLPLVVTMAVIVGRSPYFLPLTWADTGYLWVILWAGGAAYLGALSIGISGLPWREGPRQIAGGVVFGLGILLGLESPFPSWAAAVLTATTLLGGAWAWVGFEAREF